MSTTASAPSLVTSQVRLVDLHDDADCAAAYAALMASRTHQRPWDDSDGFEQTLTEWRYEDPSERAERWVVETDGVVVGVATLYVSLDDNTDKIWAEVDVHPDHRGRGAGSALAQLLERRGRELGRRELIVEVYLPPVGTGTDTDTDEHPFERFAAAHGFRAESTDNVRILDLPVPDAVLDRLEASARERWAGAYRLETHTDGLPDELVEGYCRVSNLLNVDAPTGAVDFEAETLTPERYRGYLDLERRQGRRRLTTVALETATGEVVAYTDLVLPSGAPTKTWQWGTLVDRAHRGHRLGMAVKVANLRKLQSAHPERKTVGTGNDATNSYMVGINEELGFHVVEVARMCRKVLTDL
jgi:GNAT superfamily N-acetyltransferase